MSDLKKRFLGYPNWRVRKEIERRLTGTFSVTLSSNPKIGGTVYGSGTDYKYNQQVTIRAVPGVFFDFDRWSDGNTESERTITVRDNTTLVAIFKRQQGTAYFKPNY